MSIIYGPVPSWRLGRSLGIDMISTHCKTCSFDCVYCQLGNTVNRQASRRNFVSIKQLKQELQRLQGIQADTATFSGVGEPTLAENLGEAILAVRAALSLPIAVLTNSSLIHDQHVQQALAYADIVVAKLDAPDDNMLHQINRPVSSCTLDVIVGGIKSFRSIFGGKLSMQIMFIEANRGRAHDLAEIVAAFNPDEVQLNTPLRPCGVKPLNQAQMVEISKRFSGFKHVVTAYSAIRPDVVPIDSMQTGRRRPSE